MEGVTTTRIDDQERSMDLETVPNLSSEGSRRFAKIKMRKKERDIYLLYRDELLWENGNCLNHVPSCAVFQGLRAEDRQ